MTHQARKRLPQHCRTKGVSLNAPSPDVSHYVVLITRAQPCNTAAIFHRSEFYDPISTGIAHPIMIHNADITLTTYHGRTVTGDISGTGTNAQAAAVGAAGNKKMPRTPKPVDKNGAKKARRGPKVIEENSMSSEHNSKKNPGNGVRNALVERNVAGGGPTITGREQGPVSKTASPRVSASTSGTTTMPPSPPNNRSTDASGMAPSAEMLLVRQAREAAKKEAETAGSGRRPRAPSRRALEASGRMKDQGAQWMTREKKAEETRVKTELREQRKQCKAAGLKFGVVLEAFVEGTAGAAVIGADAGGCKGGGEDDGGAGPPRNGAGWHKVSPVLL